MPTVAVRIPVEKVAEICRDYGIVRLSLFGSVLTERFTDTSDIDVLVEFKSGQRVGFLKMAALEREFSSLFGGRKVDLRTPNELSPYFREEVVKNASVQCSAA